MHIIPFNIGDFSQATERFKPVHLGIFLRLLMEYYKSEKALADDRTELEFIAAAETKSDKEALSLVLRRCFVHDSDKKVWIQKRVEREIEQYRVNGLQKRHAILCRHWEAVNGNAKRPTLEEFSANPNLYYDEATRRIRHTYGRKVLVLEPQDERTTDLPLPNYDTETRNQKPETRNQKSTAAGAENTTVGPSLKALAQAIYALYPRKKAPKKAIPAIEKVLKSGEITELELQAKVRLYAESVKGLDPQFIPYPATWFNGGCYLEDPKTWTQPSGPSSAPGFDGKKKKWGGAPADLEEKDLLSDSSSQGGPWEPEGWRAVWSQMTDAPIPAEFADVPAALRERLVDACEKNEGGVR